MKASAMYMEPVFLSISMASHHWLQNTINETKMFTIAGFCCSLVHQYDALNESQTWLRSSYIVDWDAGRLPFIQTYFNICKRYSAQYYYKQTME